MATNLDPKWIRVSSILSMIPTKGPDGLWGYPLQSIPQDVLNRKAEIGTDVHAAISSYVNNKFAVLTEAGDRYFDSFLKWEKAVGLVHAHTELRLFHEPMNLSGGIDMLAKIGGGEGLFIIDFKCTAAPDHSKWTIQAAFYALLAQLNKIDVEKRCLFVQLDANGDYPKVHEYEITKELTSTALSFYNAYLYLTRK